MFESSSLITFGGVASSIAPSECSDENDPFLSSVGERMGEYPCGPIWDGIFMSRAVSGGVRDIFEIFLKLFILSKFGFFEL